MAATLQKSTLVTTRILKRVHYIVSWLSLRNKNSFLVVFGTAQVVVLKTHVYDINKEGCM